MNHRRISILISACAIAALGAVSLTGDADVLSTASPSMTTTPGTASMRATFDPETGQLRVGASTAGVQFDPGTEQALRRDAAGLTEIHRPDGTVLIDLQGRFQSVAMVHRDANGKFFVCTTDAQDAREGINGNIPSPATPEVK